MGTAVKKWSFTAQEYSEFQQRLYCQLETLKELIRRPTFGLTPLKIGAELEMYLTDIDGNVSFSNQLLLDKLNDSQFQPELNKYNLELNLSAFLQQEQPFAQLHKEMIDKTEYLHKVSLENDIYPIAIGILPTLKQQHLHIEHMTNIARYHNLAKHLYQERGEAFEINIKGDEQLSISFNDICAEGANTSFQVHMMIPPTRFANVFNAAQLTSPLVAAIGANSPIFLGKRLWHETRVALFKQSLDIRLRNKVNWQEPTRVNFGFGWVRNDPWELFAEAVALYPTILPSMATEESEVGLPDLHELSVHMGTLWPWHRPVYCNKGNGHIRIEFRAIPAGPTAIDMVANAAFAIGLANGLSDDIERLISQIPFRFAEYNFYRAAQFGLDAKILWPHKNKYQPNEIAITEVISSLLPVADKGLAALGISKSERDTYLQVIEQRLSTKQNGAHWQRSQLDKLESKYSNLIACQHLVKQYYSQSRLDTPVAKWEQ
ncbi:hypothetical protein HII17_13525 [Thalassotalea sp. M1531]|uniref:Glutamate--cysteine ligase n=1 Tax=Thalassotalea algicola TaxID=2716224 RepID=A0A7Y0LF75_9GAMM|nr:hypothetical protein [Thalassotalea algicola]NMP32581.1 hypothetical protein [Thalassotalea algicola]